MARRLLFTLILLCLVAVPVTAEDILRICSAYYPGGCALHIYDYGGAIYDFHALWCDGELIYEGGGWGGSIGSNGNCRYFL